MFIVQYLYVLDFDDEIIANYNWNDISMVKCPRLNQNQQPIFEKYTGAVCFLQDDLAVNCYV